MNEQQWAPMCVGFAVAVVLFLIIGYFLRKRNMTAHLAPVKRELKKEKQWLRRGEYNAAMVKGRQNLELFLKLVAEFNGIELDNSAQAMANAKSSPDGKVQRETYRINGRKRQRVMTFQQFGWWLDENGYLDRVGKWELNEIRVIGNKAVHENYVSKEDAWNQYNYMEDLFRIVADHHANRHKKRGPEIKKSQAGHRGAGTKKTSGAQIKAHGQQSQTRGQNQPQKRGQNQPGRNPSKKSGQGKPEQGQPKNGRQNQAEKRMSGKQPASKSGQTVRTGGNARPNVGADGKADQQKKKAAEQRQVQKKQAPKKAADDRNVKNTADNSQTKQEWKAAENQNAQPEKMSSSAKRRQRRKRAKAAREAAEAVEMKKETAQQKETGKQTEIRTARQKESREERQQRQLQPPTAMKIVTLSPTDGGRAASGSVKKESAKSEPSKKNQHAQTKAKTEPQDEKQAKQTVRRRRRPRRKPAVKTAAGGGDHEE